MVILDDLPKRTGDFPYFFCMFTTGYPVPAEQFLRPGDGRTPVPAIIRMPAERCWALGVQGYKRFTCL